MPTESDETVPTTSDVDTHRPHGLRQIHLDFHTSRDFASVGAHFDPQEFAHTMDEAAVSSVNVFAKCHHGYSYYPTDVGTTHPGLGRDLLGEQIAALHARGIDAPIYVSVLWDDLAGELHPEWVVTNSTGQQAIRTPLSADSPLQNQRGWCTMDIASGYGDYVLAQLNELIDRYPVDGFWLDIVWVEPNYSPAAQRRLRADGVSLSDQDAVYRAAREALLGWMDKVHTLIRERVPHASLFFNGTIDAEASESVASQTHVEVESLPTSGGAWGYMHYPVTSRYARTLGKPMVGMTGRFHTSWADFGGLKPAGQLDFECGTIVAAGGAISVGDQLDPDGVLDAAVYSTIGAAFRKIRSLEPWIVDAAPMADVAIVQDTRISHAGVHIESVFSADVEGAALIFLELGLQFDIVDPRITDLSRYSAIVIPDGYRLDPTVGESIAAARSKGSRIVLSAGAALDPETREFDLPVPVRYLGPVATSPSYLVAGDIADPQLEIDSGYPYVIYGQAHRVEATDGAVGRGLVRQARFNRTWQHFTSHSHAPVGDGQGSPLVVLSEDVLYLSAPLFTLYRDSNYWVYQRTVRSLIADFLPLRTVQSVSHSQVEVSVHRLARKAGGKAYVIHLVPFAARRAFSPVPRLDETVELANVHVVLRLDGALQSAKTVPDARDVQATSDGATITLQLAVVKGHTVVEVVTQG